MKRSRLASLVIAGLVIGACDDNRQPLAPTVNMNVQGETPSDGSYLVETVYPAAEKDAAALPPSTVSPGLSANLAAPRTSSATIAGAATSYQVQAVPFAPEPAPTANRTLNCDDCVHYGVNLGFTFTFFGQSYTKVDLTSNGLLGFGGTIGASYVPNRIPTATDAPYNNMIALAWSDWYPPGGGTVTYETRGLAPNRRFVFQFSNVIEFFSGPSRLTAQLVLSEGSNNITMYVSSLSPLPNHQVTQGIEGPNGAEAYLFSSSRNLSRFTLNNDAIRFTPGAANTAPSIVAPPNITFPADGGACSAGIADLGAPDASDDAPGYVIDPVRNDGAALTDPYPVGTTTVTYTVTDVAGLTASANQTVTVNDTEPPALAQVAPISVSTDPGEAYATVSVTPPIAVDNCDAALPVSGPSGAAQYPLGGTQLSWSATDAAGNVATTSSSVTVVDTEAPTVSVPPSFSQDTDPGQPGALVIYGATAQDNSGSAQLSCTPASSSHFSIGTTPVTCTATDGAGNTASGGFSVTIVDRERPTLTIPPNITVNATMPSGAVVNFTPVAADNSGSVNVSCGPASGSTFAIGTTATTCTATDGSGNSTSGRFSVTVIGAHAQIEALIAKVTALSLHNGTSQPLLSMLATALRDPGATAPEVACIKLDDFIFKLQDHKSVASISQTNIEGMIADSRRIQNVLGCP